MSRDERRSSTWRTSPGHLIETIFVSSRRGFYEYRVSTSAPVDDNDDADVNDDDGDGEDEGRGRDSEGSEGGSVEISVVIAPGPEHKSLESPRPHILDMIQQNSLILERHENLVVIRHDNPSEKTG